MAEENKVEETVNLQEEGELVWKCSDGREIPFSEMDNDHVKKALHRSSKKAEKHESLRDKAGKKLIKVQNEYKKQNDLYNFWSTMRDKIYDEAKNRHLILQYFSEMNPDLEKRIVETKQEDIAK